MNTQDLREGGVRRGDLFDEHAAAVLSHASDAVLLTSIDGAVLASNAAARRLLRRSDAEIRAAGRAGIAVMDEAAVRFFAERRRRGRARAVLSLRRKDETTFFAEVVSAVFEGGDGTSWTSLSFRDVTGVERARRTLEILADAGGHLSHSMDPGKTLEALTTVIVPRLADVCTVDLLENGEVDRVAAAHRDPSRVADFLEVRRRRIDEGADAGTDFVLRTGEPSAVLRVTDDWLRQATHDEAHFFDARALGVQSIVSVPLRVRENTIGALTLMSTGGAPIFTDSDVSLATALGERAAIAIDNARRYEEMLEARRLRDEVLGVVAHDLRGPLNVIKLASMVLARERQCEETDSIARAVRRANALIEDLLLAAKTEQGTLPTARRVEAIAGIVDEVHALHRPIAGAREVSFDVVVPQNGEASHALVDRHRIIQMLTNVVANALDVTPPHGRVVLRVSGDADRVVFRVSDTGPGISPEDLRRVFDRFWQAAHRRRAGAGLGLTIARAVALAHGGDITVESAVGKGTTFCIMIPRRLPAKS